VVTGGLMVLSPILFDRLGWRSVAGATPQILTWGGGLFFALCISYQWMFGQAASATALSLAILNVLVVGARPCRPAGRSRAAAAALWCPPSPREGHGPALLLRIRGPGCSPGARHAACAAEPPS
jgi:hypothetical protein